MRPSRPFRASLLPTLLLTGVVAGRGVARAADPALEIEKGQNAVILEERLEIEIRSVTDARVRYLKRTRILTPRGAEEYGDDSVLYHPGVTIRDLRGTVTSPSGKRLEIKKQQVVDGAAFASFELYSDMRRRTMVFAGVVPGATIEFSYELAVSNLFYLPDDFYLQSDVPARVRTLIVSAPSAFPIRLAARGLAADQTREERDGIMTHRWQARDVPAFRPESNAPPEDDLLPRVTIAPEAILWGDQSIDAAHWDGIARFYWELARDRMVPTPLVAQTAHDLTTGAQDPTEKIRRLYEFVQGKVNYVSISLGIGGWQPHPNGDVLLHRYGDCKDKATLLIAMLHAVDLSGLPVLIRTRDEGLVERDNPFLSFNHAIVAVPRPDGYVFLDPTSEETAFGDLPWQDQGVPVLVVKEDGRGDLVETPLSPPDRNRSHRVVTAAISASGNLEGGLLIDAWGARQGLMADLASSKEAERADAVEELVSWLCPGARVMGDEVTRPKVPGDPMHVATRFAVPGFVTRAGTIEIANPHLARFPSLEALAAYPVRKQPLFFRYLFSDTVETRLDLPPGRTVKKLPTDRTTEGPGLRSTSHYEIARERNRNVLVVRQSITAARREIPASDYATLRSFLSGLAEEESAAVTLQPEN